MKLGANWAAAYDRADSQSLSNLNVVNDSISLGDTIRDRRLALGYSLGQLATKVNKTASSIRAWERGDAVPTDEESDDLAAALDLDAALLVSLQPSEEVWESEEIDEVDVHDPWPDGHVSEDLAAAVPAAAAADQAAEPAEETSEPDPDVVEATQQDAVGSESAQPELAETEEIAAVADETAAVADAAEVEDAAPDPSEFAELFDAKTEAVPVVPASSVAVATAQTDPALSASAAQPIAQRSENPVVAAWDDLRALYHRIFDPRRRWIYRVRFVLMVIVLFIMLRVLAWAAGNLFEALGEVLDSISFSAGDTPDVEN